MILGIAFTWRPWRNNRMAYGRWMALLYGDSARLWLFGVPPLMRQWLGSGMCVWYPELYYGLVVAVIPGIGWSVSCVALSLQNRRPKPRAINKEMW